MKRYNDYLIAALIGFNIGWLALFPEVHLGLQPTFALVLMSVIGFALAVPLGLFWCGLLGRRHCAIREFGKFSAVGAMNTAIDLGILNLFMFFTGYASGLFFIIAKTIAYFIANLNAFVLNKYWTFGDATAGARKQYPIFLLFSIAGAVINVGVTTALVEYIAPPFAMSAPLWANVAALIGTGALFILNFITYRTYVFARRP